MSVILEAPINALSFGNVSYNMLRALYDNKQEVDWFPLSGNHDFSVFDSINPDFHKWLIDSANKASLNINKNKKGFKIWHLNGSQSRIAPKQILYSFYELDEPTETEINLAKFQDKVYFSSSYAANMFKEKGVDADYLPLGFDKDFHKTNQKYLDEDIIHFGLMGKFEKRKHTKKIIQLWLKLFGNNNKYQLSVCCINPFYKPEEMKALLSDLLDGKRYTNLNMLPFLKKNSDVNHFLNAIDIDLTGLSGAEGWNLPAFNATCLGKWSIVLNATAHKDWADKDNCLLVEPNGKEEAYDGKFFVKGSPFNQGSIYTWDSDTVAQMMEQACLKKGQNNAAGESLKENFSYEKSVSLLNKGLESL